MSGHEVFANFLCLMIGTVLFAYTSDMVHTPRARLVLFAISGAFAIPPIFRLWLIMVLA
jgi:hypothetical protein